MVGPDPSAPQPPGSAPWRCAMRGSGPRSLSSGGDRGGKRLTAEMSGARRLGQRAGRGQPDRVHRSRFGCLKHALRAARCTSTATGGPGKCPSRKPVAQEPVFSESLSPAWGLHTDRGRCADRRQGRKGRPEQSSPDPETGAGSRDTRAKKEAARFDSGGPSLGRKRPRRATAERGSRCLRATMTVHCTIVNAPCGPRH